MILRKTVVLLVAGFFLLLVAFSVFMGGYALCVATEDPHGALILWWVSMFALMLMVVDVVLLVACLALAYLVESKTDVQEKSVGSIGDK